VAAKGYTALKTNPIVFDGTTPRLLNPGFRPGLELGRNGDARTFEAIAQQLAAFRAGAGEDVDLLLDVNFGFSCEALRQLAQRLEPLGLFWLEADVHGPAALAEVRRATRTPIASLESIYRLKGFLPYFEAAACDVAIIDVVWNGLPESLKIAATAEAFEVNVAPHNFYGHIASLISAHFAAVVPNLRIVEYEVDDVPWKDELVTHPPVIEAGQMLVPDRPGWGADVNEEALKAHPPRG
jgi:L-alanine-DL-glutamate epimerase-like enolase superfamily enzyme